jgi:hypothetical protein
MDWQKILVEKTLKFTKKWGGGGGRYDSQYNDTQHNDVQRNNE